MYFNFHSKLQVFQKESKLSLSSSQFTIMCKHISINILVPKGSIQVSPICLIIDKFFCLLPFMFFNMDKCLIVIFCYYLTKVSCFMHQKIRLFNVGSSMHSLGNIHKQERWQLSGGYFKSQPVGSNIVLEKDRSVHN